MDIELKEGDTLVVKIPYADSTIEIKCTPDQIDGWLNTPRLRPWPAGHRTRRQFGARIEKKEQGE